MLSEEAEQLSPREVVYTPLGRYLRGVSANEDAVLAFADVEELIGRPLPAQARTKPEWRTSIPRQPQSRAWLRADRRAEVSLADETVTFVWEVFVRNNQIERIQRMRADWLGYARSCLARPPARLDDPHVESGWWEPHQVYLIHLPKLGKFKVGLTRTTSKRVASVGGASAEVVDSHTFANRWAALVIEHHVLDSAWDAWESPDRFAFGDRGETERWNDWLIPPPLSVIHDSLDADTQLPGWDLSIFRGAV